jgi:hypothetical protein
MPEWGSPAWLVAAFAAVAVIWWLHWPRGPDAARLVSALYLWRSRAVDPMRGATVRRRADPRWRLRALIAACACFAASQLYLPDRAPLPLEIWFDNSASMQAREATGPRRAEAVTLLTSALQDEKRSAIRVRALGSPAASLELETGPLRQRRQLAGWLEDRVGEPLLPAPPTMSGDAEHWLVSDGADPRLANWLAGAPVSRVIQVGKATENVSVSQLAVRRSLRMPQTYAGSVAVSNAGTTQVTRRLRLSAEQGVFSNDVVDLAPGETVLRAFSFTAATGKRVEAALDAADALPDDDNLALENLPISFKVSVDSACGEAVRAVLAAHPALDLADASGGDASLHVACGTTPPAKQPALWLHKSTAATAVEPPVVWHENAGRLRKLNLSPAWLRRSARPPDGSDVSAAVLSSRAGPLVMISPTHSGVLEVWIDMESASLVTRPEYPALLGGLLELVLDPSRLDGSATVSRPSVSYAVAPRRLSVSKPVDDARVIASRLDLTPLLIVLTLLLMLVDMRPVTRQKPSEGPVG